MLEIPNSLSIQDLDILLAIDKETEHVEFKEAKNNFSFEKLCKYISALANEWGGYLILWVKDELINKTREVVGTSYVVDENKILNLLCIKIKSQSIYQQKKKILVLIIPSRSTWEPVYYEWIPYMRVGESLKKMDQNIQKKIWNERESDFSAESCFWLLISDLDPIAMRNMKEMYAKRMMNEDILSYSNKKILEDLSLIKDNKLTYASLILLGKQEAIRNFLPQAKIVYEYKADDGITNIDRVDYWVDIGWWFFSYFKDLENKIDAKNKVYTFQSGLYRKDIKLFNIEDVIREWLLNAVAHRNYKKTEFVFIRQYPKKIIIESPGGFPLWVTKENIIEKTKPGNMLISEILRKTWLVEQSWQWVDRMMKASIKEGKGMPSYQKSDVYQVVLEINALIQDASFIEYFYTIATQQQINFSIEHLILLQKIKDGTPIKRDPRLDFLLKEWLIERRGKWKYMLAKKYYSDFKKKGEYTKLKGLERAKIKEILINYIKQHNWLNVADFRKTFTELTKWQVDYILMQLKESKQIYYNKKEKIRKLFIE